MSQYEKLPKTCLKLLLLLGEGEAGLVCAICDGCARAHVCRGIYRGQLRSSIYSGCHLSTAIFGAKTHSRSVLSIYLMLEILILHLNAATTADAVAIPMFK